MKKQFLLLASLISITCMLYGQAPNAIPYQGVARNASGSILASQTISLRISIHDLTETGSVVFSETHSVVTTSLGLFNLDIGTGAQIIGTLAEINWGSGAKFIQIEMDALGGSTYLDMGTTKLNSVPYALYAGKAAALPDGTTNGNTIHWNGTEWVADTTITNDGSNIGIGTATAGTKLDINGDMALRSADITIATTYNYALDVYTDKQSVYRLLQTQGLGNFVIAGLDGGANGRLITLINSTGATLELDNDQSGASPAHRILTGTGSNMIIRNGGSVTVRYDSSISKWEVLNSTYSYWGSSGNDIHNLNTGNVGISGTAITTPGFNGSLTSGGSLRIENNDNNFFLKSDGSTIQAEKSNLQTTGTTASDLLLNPYGGNVGIGTNIPSNYKLFVNGSIYTDNAVINEKLTFFGGFGSKISLANGGSQDYGIGIDEKGLQFYVPHYVNLSQEFNFGWGSSTDFHSTMTFSPKTAQLAINCLPQEGYNLAVNGAIRSTEVVVETGWADYVFGSTYKLKPLTEVEDFIKQNNHLPNIPSATEIQKDGLKVGELQTKMMEKIEELTLYVIELKKEIELLKSNDVKK